MAAACAGTFAALDRRGCSGFAAIGLFPHSVPDIVGPVMVPGTSAAARQAEDAREASDPYWGYLLFSALLLGDAVGRRAAAAQGAICKLSAARARWRCPPLALALVTGRGRSHSRPPLVVVPPSRPRAASDTAPG